MLRYIVIPEDVALAGLDGLPAIDMSVSPPETIVEKFRKWVDARLIDRPFATPVPVPMQDMPVPVFNWDADAVRALKAVRTALLKAQPGDVVAIDDNHWERLVRSVKHPSPPGYPPLGAIQLESFFTAILDAPSTPPEKDAAE